MATNEPHRTPADDVDGARDRVFAGLRAAMPAARLDDTLAPGVTGTDSHWRAARPAHHKPPWRPRPALISSWLP